MKITTNNVPRPFIPANWIEDKERKEFDYLDWDAIDEGKESYDFFRYKGQLYNVDELQVWSHDDNWDRYFAWTYFSGIVIKFVRDDEEIIVGRYCT
jgi:hypothetical protein